MPVTRVAELMSTAVETLAVGDTLAAARRQLERGRIRHLPVVDGGGRLVGLLTLRKVLSACVSHGHPERESVAEVARDVPVEMLMERDVVAVGPDTPASEAAALLEETKIGCLPVVTGEDGTLVGIVTDAHFVRFARRFLEWEERGEARSAALPG